MRPDRRVLLADFDSTSADFRRFIEGMDSAIYTGEAQMQAAVERKFEIIDEALNRLQKSHPKLAGRIPRLRRIIDIRNLVIHGYASVIPERVWDHAENHLSQLPRIVQGLLTDLGPPEE